MLQEELFIPLNISTYLHMHHLQGHPKGPVVFLLHGAIENGRIFYSPHKPKGLAWFLAQKGFDVYIPDLGGRGLSYPPITQDSAHGQSESIGVEIPALLDFIQAHRPLTPQIWMAHSWGGVLLMATLARFPSYLKDLKAHVFFGSKRSVYGYTPEKLLKIHFFWNRLAFVFARAYGYLPAQRLGLGSDSESLKSHRQSVAWVKPGTWTDSDDGFDYAQALQHMSLPPQLHLAGAHDLSLGHPEDVQKFRSEISTQSSDYWLLGNQTGFKHNYGHIDMLTHPDAPEDIFAPVLQWLQPFLT